MIIVSSAAQSRLILPFVDSAIVFSAFRQQVDLVPDVPYYMTITVSGPMLRLNHQTTDYAISVEVIYV